MMTQGNDTKPQPEAAKSQMAWMFLASIVIATANTLLYKAALNAFSSPTTNYAFFASQFSILLYVFQALLFSIFIVARDWNSIKELFRIPQSVYLLMGFLDSASGANCPGGIQTVLNQLIIPITMIGASCFLNAKFETSQLWGSAFIVLGAVVASSGYMYASDPTSGGSEQSSSGAVDVPSTSGVSAAVAAAVVLYFISVIPSAMSNIYKEGKMKEQDMSEVHTSTVVSFWQLWFGFLFLPLMSLPQLGGLTFKEMSSQLSDGFTCFMGTNPGDPDADCSNAAYLLLAYITVNFFYNILMLAITKRGSAVLLVIAQALSLPVTNIAFTLRIFMGDDAEPLTALNLLGLVLVCIGFLTYSGFGLASNFMVAQGPPGQMAYVHFDDVSELIVSTEMALRPEQLVDFLVQATLQQQTTQLHHRGKTPEGSHKTGEGASPRATIGGYSSLLDLAEKPASQRIASAGNLEIGNGEETPLIQSGHSSGTALAVANEPTELSASREALRVARLAVLLLEDRVTTLERQEADPNGGQGGSYVDTVSNSSSSVRGARLEMNAVSQRK